MIFKIKLSPEKIQSYFDSTKKEFKSELNAIKPASQPESAYNLEEFAIEEDPELDNIHLKTDDSKFEINKEALKPTISHSSEIDLNPVVKPVQMDINPVTVTAPVHTEEFVIEKAEEEDIIEENLGFKISC